MSTKSDNSKIKLLIPSDLLGAYDACRYELEQCGKAALHPDRIMKLSDTTFDCIYSGIERVTRNEVRYPNKDGREYANLLLLLSLLREEYFKQKGKNYLYDADIQ